MEGYKEERGREGNEKERWRRYIMRERERETDLI